MSKQVKAARATLTGSEPHTFLFTQRNLKLQGPGRREALKQVPWQHSACGPINETMGERRNEHLRTGHQYSWRGDIRWLPLGTFCEILGRQDSTEESFALRGGETVLFGLMSPVVQEDLGGRQGTLFWYPVSFRAKNPAKRS